MPHQSLLQIKREISLRQPNDNRKLRPQLGLIGSKDYLCPINLAVLDLDYNAGKDEGDAIKVRNEIIKMAQRKSMLIFASNSGTGAHILIPLSRGFAHFT